MSTGHQMLTYAICTHQQWTQISRILVKRIKRGKQEESWCFGLHVTEVCVKLYRYAFFLKVCQSDTNVHTDLLYVWRMCITTVCGEGVVLKCVCTYEGGSAPFGCDGGPWCVVGLQQCGGQAGAVSHFGYVHIRSRSMAPPNECHFLRSNTQT